MDIQSRVDFRVLFDSRLGEDRRVVRNTYVRIKHKVWKGLVEAIQWIPKERRMTKQQRKLYSSALEEGLTASVYDTRGHIRPTIGIVFNELKDEYPEEEALTIPE